MWANRLADLNDQIAVAAATRSNYASVALIFDGTPVVGSDDIRLDFTAEALDNYQKVIAIALASKMADELPERGPLPGADRSRLFIRDLVRGSMGFILEEVAPGQGEMLPTGLKEAVEGTTRLLTTLSSASDSDFDSALEGTQPRLLSADRARGRVRRCEPAERSICSGYWATGRCS